MAQKPSRAGRPADLPSEFETDLAVVELLEQASRTSTSLLRRVRTFDEEAWQALVATYGERVYRWCRVAKLQHEVAIDVTQDVFIAVFGSMDRFRRERQSDGFRKWLRGITAKRIGAYWRRQFPLSPPVGGSDWQGLLGALEAPHVSGSTSDGGTSRSDDDIRRQAIEHVRRETTARDWAILERLALSGQSAVKVADEFGVSVNVVYLVRSRLMRRIRERENQLKDRGG